MKYFKSVFFCDKGNPPKASILISSEPLNSWPVSMHFESNYTDDGDVSVHFYNESDLIKFKNSVLDAYNSYRRTKGYDR